MIDVSKIRRTLLIGMFLLAAGALAIHFNIHSPVDPPADLAFPNTAASVFALFDAAVVTWLFSRKKTAAWGYLFNGLLVIYGTVFMTHFGWSHNAGPDTSFFGYLYHATTPEIIIAWADFCLGAVLYRLWFIEPAATV
jgi:hypothetical protein